VTDNPSELGNYVTADMVSLCRRTVMLVEPQNVSDPSNSWARPRPMQYETKSSIVDADAGRSVEDSCDPAIGDSLAYKQA